MGGPAPVLVIIRQVPTPRVDPVDRAHLTGRTRPSPPIHRYPPAPDLVELVDRYWIPVWSLTEPSRQSTLQHPVCLIVVSDGYARFYGVVRGLSTVTLHGDGWAVGVMFTPAAGKLVLGRPVTAVTDTWCDLAEIDRLDAEALVAEIRAVMTAAPADPDAHRRAIAAYELRLRALLPVDEAGLLINEVIGWLREHPEVTRVAEVAEAFATTERSLQRLVLDRVGLSPKWLIQRRRLHDAVARIKAGSDSLAELAAELGYTDQSHFTHDFKAVCGLTPGAYLADQPGGHSMDAGD